jgi:ABC-type nickel/cobalt efflux system permease component RcnA
VLFLRENRAYVNGSPRICFLKTMLPFLLWWPRVNRHSLRCDLLAGLTGGLIPCPASITVLLLCLQLKEVALGATLVLGFSVGLALSMVASGAVAALGVRHAAKRWGGFGHWADKAPLLSVGLMILVAGFMGWQGWQGLVAAAA